MNLTVEERPTANDGIFTTTYAVPDDLLAGDEICDQGFLSGDTSGGGFGQDRSDQVCFTVEEGSETESGTVSPPAPESPPESGPPDAAPPESAPPAPLSPTPGTDVLGEQLSAQPEEAAPRQPAAVTPEVAGPPAPEVLGDTLPRTGRETQWLMLAGGMVLMLGGFGLIGGNRRPGRVPYPP
ncbi:MAG: LPXTG cell wall anchor domain-containing protein [Acidimicrobiia bacterium]